MSIVSQLENRYMLWTKCSIGILEFERRLPASGQLSDRLINGCYFRLIAHNRLLVGDDWFQWYTAVSGGAINWVDFCRYLGVLFNSGCTFKWYTTVSGRAINLVDFCRYLGVFFNSGCTFKWYTTVFGGAINWVDFCRYLGVFFNSGCTFKWYTTVSGGAIN